MPIHAWGLQLFLYKKVSLLLSARNTEKAMVLYIITSYFQTHKALSTCMTSTFTACAYQCSYILRRRNQWGQGAVSSPDFMISLPPSHFHIRNQLTLAGNHLKACTLVSVKFASVDKPLHNYAQSFVHSNTIFTSVNSPI